MWFKAAGIFFAIIFVAFVFLLGCQSQWQRRTEQLVQDFYKQESAAEMRTQATNGADTLLVYQPEKELPGLPQPVQRFFQTVLTPQQPLVAHMTLSQKGQINLSPDQKADAWKGFSARQDVIMHSPRFIWQAKVSMAPGINAYVIDSYNQGRGWLQAKVMGLVTVAEEEGSGDIAEGELMRFLAESPWYPTRLLPSQGVQWQEIDDTSAEARLAVAGQEVALTFIFNDQGLIETVKAESRYRENIDGEAIYAPWVGHFSDYRNVEGMLLPHKAEVGWMQSGGAWQPYWQGRVTDWDIRFYPIAAR